MTSLLQASLASALGPEPKLQKATVKLGEGGSVSAVSEDEVLDHRKNLKLHKSKGSIRRF